METTSRCCAFMNARVLGPKKAPPKAPEKPLKNCRADPIRVQVKGHLDLRHLGVKNGAQKKFIKGVPRRIAKRVQKYILLRGSKKSSRSDPGSEASNFPLQVISGSLGLGIRASGQPGNRCFACRAIFGVLCLPRGDFLIPAFL